MKEIDSLTKTQRERLAHIEFRAYFLGSVGRKDLSARFGIKEAAATRDFTKYNELAPRNLNYDTRAKVYIPSDSFKPIFDYSANRVLATLAKGFGDGLKDDLKADQGTDLLFETPTQLNQPKLDVLAQISRAITNQQAIEVGYRSLSSGETRREIVPFALVDNGLRWHTRAYDRKRRRFTDFVITRIFQPKLLPDSPVEPHEKPSEDKQWNHMVSLELIPHPSIEHSAVIESDYGMRKGVLRIRLRAAVAGYVLRRWNVDCSAGHQLQGSEYHLALRNIEALDDNVDTMALAPGYSPGKG